MKNHWALAVICILGTSCVTDIDGSSGSNGGVGGHSTSGGGNGPSGDAFPAGAVAFFNRLSCPPDWSAFDDAAGRMIIAANAGLPRGTSIGEPLSSGEDRVHQHELSAPVVVASEQGLGLEPGPNGLFTSGGMYTFGATSEPAPADVPYRQLLVCKKIMGPKADVLPLPAKLHSYFDLDACPSGWKTATATAGRIVIGLPAEAPADTPLGGEPMTSPEPRTHTHAFSSTLIPTPIGKPLSPSCCSTVGKIGEVPFTGESDPAAVDIPLITLLHCEKS
jgi:hypothetical protein